MSATRLKLRQLRAAQAIAGEGSIGAAARKLGVTQSALSKSLRELEDELGVPAFVREARGVRLTQAGQSVIETADTIFGELARLDDHLEAMMGTKERVVRLGALPVAASGLLPGVLARFKALFPDVAVRVVQGGTGDLLPRLAAGEFDLVVGRLYPPMMSDALERETFYHEPIGFLARATHPLFCIERVEIADLARFDLVLPTASQRLGREIDEMLASLSIDAAQALRTSSPAMLRQMLDLGDYLAVAPSMMMANDIRLGSVRPVTLNIAHAERPAGIVHRGASALGRDARAMIRVLREHLADTELRDAARPNAWISPPAAGALSSI